MTESANTASASLVPTTAHEVEGLGLVVVIEPAVLERRARLLTARSELGPVTRHNLVEADRVVGDMAIHNRTVETGRKGFKAPYLTACQLIDEAATAAKIGGDLDTLTRDVARVKRELEAEADAAAAERARIAREAEQARERAEAEAAERQRVLDELERRAATPEDHATLDALREESEVAEAEAHQTITEAASRAWVAAAERESPPMPRLGTHTKRPLRLEIFDITLIPREVNGIATMVPDEAAINRLLKANVPVPGCRLSPRDEVSAGRRR